MSRLLTLGFLIVLLATFAPSAFAGGGLGHGRPSPPRPSAPVPVAAPVPAPAPQAPQAPAPASNNNSSSGDVAVISGNGQASLSMQGVLMANIGGAQAVVQGAASVSGSCQRRGGGWLCTGSFSATGQFSVSANGNGINLSAVGRGKLSFRGVSGSTTVNGQSPLAWSSRTQTIQFGR